MSFDILVVCTANVSRSPMAEAVLADAVARRGLDVTVRSAGLMRVELPVDPMMASLMAERGIDISGHRPRQVGPDDVASVDLVVAMTRQHVRSLVTDVRSPFPRTFTLKEVERRLGSGSRVAARDLAGLHHGRTAAELLGDSTIDDIDDPFGRARSVYAACAAEIDRAVDSLVAWLDDSETLRT
ncbi:MAG: hypothetical protein ACO307_12235 [Ilumatobacteraceae bacterium]